MVIIENRIVYLATPRSASRSTSALLVSLGGVLRRPHHTPISAVMAVNLPTITLLRDPAHIMLSFWWRTLCKMPLLEYIETGFEPLFASDHIYPYYRVTDEYFLYSKGVKAFAEHLGFTDIPEIPRIGIRSPDYTLLTEEHRDAIRKRFPQDVELFDSFS